MFNDTLHKAVDVLERGIAILLVVMAALGIVDLVVEMYDAVTDTGFLTPEAIVNVLDSVLIVFIVLELFSIALAYLERRNIIGTVMEAGLVAVVRKLVIFETNAAPEYVLMKGAALSLLIISVGVTWYLLRRSGICQAHGSEH